MVHPSARAWGIITLGFLPSLTEIHWKFDNSGNFIVFFIWVWTTHARHLFLLAEILPGTQRKLLWQHNNPMKRFLLVHTITTPIYNRSLPQNYPCLSKQLHSSGWRSQTLIPNITSKCVISYMRVDCLLVFGNYNQFHHYYLDDFCCIFSYGYPPPPPPSQASSYAGYQSFADNSLQHGYGAMRPQTRPPRASYSSHFTSSRAPSPNTGTGMWKWHAHSLLLPHLCIFWACIENWIFKRVPLSAVFLNILILKLFLPHFYCIIAIFVRVDFCIYIENYWK